MYNVCVYTDTHLYATDTHLYATVLCMFYELHVRLSFDIQMYMYQTHFVVPRLYRKPQWNFEFQLMNMDFKDLLEFFHGGITYMYMMYVLVFKIIWNLVGSPQIYGYMYM